MRLYSKNGCDNCKNTHKNFCDTVCVPAWEKALPKILPREQRTTIEDLIKEAQGDKRIIKLEQIE